MGTVPNDCGCCTGLSAVVPEPLENRPGQSAVHYRVGTHAEFLRSALAALSDPEFPALRSLTTRTSDDFTIALLDGWSTFADVFTFYQERIANELWLRTATERDSIVRLAQLIGYRLKAGVAAETPLSFLLDETPSAPTEVTLEIGAKVQSVAGAGEKPQTFETIEPLQARVGWNTLQPALTSPPAIFAGQTSLYLQGIATNLNPGDAILIVGDERALLADSERWDLRVLLSVTPDAKANRTHVRWEKGLGKNAVLPAALNPNVYCFRQRAALFGHNAPDPALITNAPNPWPNFTLPKDHIDLDNAYAKIVSQSWVCLTNSDDYSEVYQAERVSFPSRAEFALSAKVTRIVPDTLQHFEKFGLRETVVHAQSELLEMTAGPLPPQLGGALKAEPGLLAPVQGSIVALDRLIPELPAGRKVVVTGKLLRARVLAATLTLTSLDGLQTRSLTKGDSLVVTEAIELLSGLLAKWTLRTDDGFEGTVTTAQSKLILSAARADDAPVSELAIIQKCAGDPTAITIRNPPLTHVYDRATVTIAANVATATHGETVSEVLGSGDGAQRNQQFKLRQTPLTYVHSSAPGGAESTLQVRVNDLLWHEAPTFFERGPRERIFTTELAADGTTTIRFGDGVHGARLPSGSQNVTASYRRGLGLEGLVRPEQLTTLLTRPPGLKSAVNPLAAEGADEPESFANAQENAPLTVLTLDRVVSLQDYQDFTRSYAGIAKALATWTWDGRTRGVFLTVAGPRGATVTDSLGRELIAAIHLAGDPFVPVRVAPYLEAHFRLSGQLVVDSDYEAEKVLATVVETLRAAFAFEQRSFGQPVVLSEVIALVQRVAGVVAVNLKTLYRAGLAMKLNARLEADLPSGGDPNSLGAAELLTLDPVPIDLEVAP
jgi:hypothetical protein